MTLRCALPLSALLALSLPAQDAERSTLGIQVRVSNPEAGLRDVTGAGDFKLPGLGASLSVEMDLSEGFRGRVDLGADRWDQGPMSGKVGVEGKVSAYHVGLEGVMFLNPEDTPAWGPYLLAGLGGYAWNVGEEDTATSTSTSRRTLHVAGTLGIGFRMARSLDLEIKALGGRIDPTLFGGAIILAATYRF